MMKKLSVVLPAYGEEQNIDMASRRVGAILKENNVDFELVFVDDGSKDRTWEEIRKASEKYDYVRGVHFSRNFGKDAAIMAGLGESCGDCVVVIDCDLQHPPEKIVDMYRLWEEGYEIVEGVKTDRGKESKLHKLLVGMFYTLISKTAGFEMADSSDFKLLDRKVVDAIVNLKEKNVFFRAMTSWVGFKRKSVEFEVQERIAGESKWSTIALMKYAIRNITSFSAAPMQLVTVMGIIMLVLSLVIGGISIAKYFMGSALEGFTTVIIVQLFSCSLIMISMGIIGYYIARIFDEEKRRPGYIISETCGKENE